MWRKWNVKYATSKVQIMPNDRDFQFWTNLPNYAVFQAMQTYSYLRSSCVLKYWIGSKTSKASKSSKPGKESSHLKWNFSFY